MESRFHELRATVGRLMTRFANTTPAEVASSDLVAYVTVSRELADLHPLLVRISGDRTPYVGYDQMTASERLRASGNQNCRGLIAKLPETPRVRWPWQDELEALEAAPVAKTVGTPLVTGG